jgi:hypothetical protein
MKHFDPAAHDLPRLMFGLVPAPEKTTEPFSPHAQERRFPEYLLCEVPFKTGCFSSIQYEKNIYFTNYTVQQISPFSRGAALLFRYGETIPWIYTTHSRTVISPTGHE